MGWKGDKAVRRGAVPVGALFIGWTLATAILVGVGATYYQQSQNLVDLYLWLSIPVIMLLILLLFALFSMVTKPKAEAAPAPRPTHVSRRETTYGRR